MMAGGGAAEAPRYWLRRRRDDVQVHSSSRVVLPDQIRRERHSMHFRQWEVNILRRRSEQEGYG